MTDDGRPGDSAVSGDGSGAGRHDDALQLSVADGPHRVDDGLSRTLTVAGPLDATSHDAFVEQVRATTAELVDGAGDPGAGARPIVLVDLDDVTWCDSSGLGALVRAVTASSHEGVSVRLAARPHSAVARMVARVAMTEVLALHASVPDALADPEVGPLEAEVREATD